MARPTQSLLPPTPNAPTLSLPPLTKLSSHSSSQIQSALANLRALYFPSASSSSVIGSENGTATSTETQSKAKSEPTTILDTDSSHLTLPKPKRVIQHPIHDTTVPDSGYASAEEEEEGDLPSGIDAASEDDESEESEEPEASDLAVLRADPLERAYAIKWVTGLVARSDVWLEGAGSSSSQGRKDNSDDAEGVSDDEETQLSILDEATALLSAFSRPSEDGEDDEEGEEDASLTRTFSFPLSPLIAGTGTLTGRSNTTSMSIDVQLNDAPLSTTDHTSVGLQSWGSSIVLAERMCASPGVFLPEITPASSKAKANKRIKDANNEGKGKEEKEKEEGEGEEGTKQPLRILELGAGTGMLSIVAAKILRADEGEAEVEVVATDYHPDVLNNLRRNVETNFPLPNPPCSPLAEKEPPIQVQVHALDWSSPPIPSSHSSSSPSSTSASSSSHTSSPPSSSPEAESVKPSTPFDKPFDLILAADVIYHPQHAEWIRGCVEGMLRRPESEPKPSSSSLTSPSAALGLQSSSGSESSSGYFKSSKEGSEDKQGESSCSSSPLEEQDLEQDHDHGHDQGGTFWLIIPLRTTGRHAGMDASVEGVFPDIACLHPSSKRSSQREVNGEEQGPGEMRLAVLHREEIPRKGGVGRADEGGYKLYRIGWVEV